MRQRSVVKGMKLKRKTFIRKAGTLQYQNIAPGMHAGYFDCLESAKCLGRPFFEGRGKILLLGEALKFWGIFHKFTLKLLKISKGFTKIFVF